MRTETEAVDAFKLAFLSGTGTAPEDELDGPEAVNLQALARQVLKASDLVAARVLPGVLAPLENEFRQLNRELPVEETENIEPFRDRGWRNDLAQDVVGMVHLDFLHSIPAGFRESILASDPNSAEWGRQFVEYVATDQRRLVEELARQIAERKFLRPLRKKVHDKRVETSRGKVDKMEETEREFRAIQTEVERIQGEDPMPGGLGFKEKIAHRRGVTQKIMAAVGPQIKAALKLDGEPSAGELKQIETVLTKQAEHLRQFEQLGGGTLTEQRVQGCALLEAQIAEAEAEKRQRDRAAYDRRVEEQWRKDHPGPDQVPPTPVAFARSAPANPDEDPANRGYGEGRDLLPFVVIAGGDREGRTRNLHAMFDEPVAPEALERSGDAVTKARGKTVDVQPTSVAAVEVEGVSLDTIDTAALKDDPVARKKWNDAIDAKLTDLEKARMGGSSTMKADNVNVVQAKVNWLKADEQVRQAATDPAFDPTPENLMKLMSEVNTSLGENVFEEDQTPGEMRAEGNAGAGTHKAPMDVHDSDHWAFEYVNGDEVEREMLNLCRWVSARIKAGDDPIETAGLAYQRMVSIHPFHDGNGRSSRFLMDFALQKAGLLPAALGDNVNVAQFPRLSPDSQPSTTGAVNITVEGVKAAYEKAGAKLE